MHCLPYDPCTFHLFYLFHTFYSWLLGHDTHYYYFQQSGKSTLTYLILILFLSIHLLFFFFHYWIFRSHTSNKYDFAPLFILTLYILYFFIFCMSPFFALWVISGFFDEGAFSTLPSLPAHWRIFKYRSTSVVACETLFRIGDYSIGTSALLRTFRILCLCCLATGLQCLLVITWPVTQGHVMAVRTFSSGSQAFLVWWRRCLATHPESPCVNDVSHHMMDNSASREAARTCFLCSRAFGRSRAGLPGNPPARSACFRLFASSDGRADTPPEFAGFSGNSVYGC